jgi:hypothetical protein
VAVEALLTDKHIPTYSKPAKGKSRKPLSLHDRIAVFRLKDAENAELLEAVKWLGNYGSHHMSNLKVEDVFIAADMLETVIARTYDPQPSLAHTAKKINKKKGPI